MMLAIASTPPENRPHDEPRKAEAHGEWCPPGEEARPIVRRQLLNGFEVGMNGAFEQLTDLAKARPLHREIVVEAQGLPTAVTLDGKALNRTCHDGRPDPAHRQKLGRPSTGVNPSPASRTSLDTAASSL